MARVKSLKVFIVHCILAVALFMGIMVFESLTSTELLQVYAAENLEDNLTSDENSSNVNSSESQEGGTLQMGTISEEDQNIADWVGNQRGFTSDQLEKASNTLSPITNMIGYIIGAIVALATLGIFLITALDLLYIAFPPVRNLLYKAGTDGTGAYTGGGMAGGYGRGMMGMGMAGAGGAAGGTNKPTQWVSDEAVQCAALMGGSAQAANGAGMVGGMYGGMQNQAQQQQSTKSVIGTYLRKRAFFIILFVICMVVLTSSALMGTGANLAQWGIRIINMINGYIPA